jgi:hypothetical protein
VESPATQPVKKKKRPNLLARARQLVGDTLEKVMGPPECVPCRLCDQPVPGWKQYQGSTYDAVEGHDCPGRAKLVPYGPLADKPTP